MSFQRVRPSKLLILPGLALALLLGAPAGPVAADAKPKLAHADKAKQKSGVRVSGRKVR